MAAQDSSFDVAGLLPELLDQVLRDVEDAVHLILSRTNSQCLPIQEDYLAVSSTPYGDSTVHEDTGSLIVYSSPILPFIRVCKQWKQVVERRLYHSIVLRAARHRDPLPLLLRTLKESPHLAGLVRELRMLEPFHRGPSHTGTVAEIVSACPQLSHLTVIGFAANKEALEALRNALSMLTSLRSLVLVQYDSWRGFSDTHKHGLCSMTELLGWMSRWQDIEHVVVLTSPQRPSDRFSAQTTTSNYHFPRLRMFSFLRPPASQSALCLLGAATSHLDTLRVYLDSGSTRELHAALVTWAPMLQTLHLEHPPQLVFEDRLDDILCQLSTLRNLHAGVRLITPSMLHHLLALEVLEYDIESSSHVDELVGVVPQLPNLRYLMVPRSPTGSSSEVAIRIKVLRATCSSRGVKFVDCVREPPPNRYRHSRSFVYSDDEDDEFASDHYYDSDDYAQDSDQYHYLDDYHEDSDHYHYLDDYHEDSDHYRDSEDYPQDYYDSDEDS
ncbi:hypothetical protein BC629DRAFT_1493857 [Irpex lacteus]|nr:hypothetical protein BC629DRAFT_1493857 [Irpex lacteus]